MRTTFFVCAALQLDLTSDRHGGLPSWGGGCQPGQPAARVGPTITFSHLPFLEPCRSGAGMDRRCRACMLMGNGQWVLGLGPVGIHATRSGWPGRMVHGTRYTVHGSLHGT